MKKAKSFPQILIHRIVDRGRKNPPGDGGIHAKEKT